MREKKRPHAGLYVHIPFCKNLCLYCDFYSKVARPGEIDAYLDALNVEASFQAKTEFGKFRFDSVFIGGGTPSILNPAQIEALFKTLRTFFIISPDSEISIECNPSSLAPEHLDAYRAAGINRISLGVQSFNDRHLHRLGRLHDSRGAANAIKMIREHGFENFSLDLIFGIPDQTLFDWIDDLKMVRRLETPHLSAYNLIIEPETPFGKLYNKGKLKMPSEDLQSMMYSALVKHLTEAGYHHYEISNFARPESECRHNLKYWRLEPFLGLGPSAVSFDGTFRIKNEANLPEYIKTCSSLEMPAGESEQLDPDKLREETIMMSLRLSDGLSCGALKKTFGYDILNDKARVIEDLVGQGYITLDKGFIKLTPEALFISDEIIVKLL